VARHVRAAEIGLAIAPQGQVYLPPIMSAYVGADITSGILAAKLAELRGVTLFVDIGTNGEMVLAVNGQLTATSTAAGPAFEGMNIACGMRASRGAIEMVSLSGNNIEIKTIANAPPVGLCGSGLLDVVGELAAHGGVDKNGRFQTNGAFAGSSVEKSIWPRSTANRFSASPVRFICRRKMCARCNWPRPPFAPGSS
jgi:uncharacterized 2Fe-2S/4Fe-4S cluster protein (DUF4445 family)